MPQQATTTYSEAACNVAQVELKEHDVKDLFGELEKPVAATRVGDLIGKEIAAHGRR